VILDPYANDVCSIHAGETCHVQEVQQKLFRSETTSYSIEFPTTIEKVVAHYVECVLRFCKMIQVHLFKLWVQFPYRKSYRPQRPGNRDEVSLGGDQGLGNFGYRVLQF
jgi:hypothetical protein